MTINPNELKPVCTFSQFFSPSWTAENVHGQTQTWIIIVVAAAVCLMCDCSFQTVMDFRHPDGGLVALVLPAGSLLVMKGESRYLWSHG